MLGFAFYLQPCLLPLLAEMPPGAAGVRLMTAATRTVIMGVATVVGAREGRRGLTLSVVTDVDAMSTYRAGVVFCL